MAPGASADDRARGEGDGAPGDGDRDAVALDIGVSMVRVARFLPTPMAGSDLPCRGGYLELKEFSTIRECLDALQSQGITTIKATGEGVFRHSRIFEEHLGIQLEILPDMECLVAGATFMLQDAKNQQEHPLFPFLLVNFGTGVNMIKVEGHNVFKRVSGTTIGGGALRGLSSLATSCQSFQSFLDLCSNGESTGVDLLVTDMHGTTSTEAKLPHWAIAASLGKLSWGESTGHWREEDIAMSLLRMIVNNISQIASLTAAGQNVKKTVFTGSFLRGPVVNVLRSAMQFWSPAAQPVFLHSDYLKTAGAFLAGPRCCSTPPMTKKGYTPPHLRRAPEPLSAATKDELSSTLLNAARCLKASGDLSERTFNYIVKDLCGGELGTKHINTKFNEEFTLIKQLGRGADGVVYMCRHKFDGQVYAVKQIHVRKDLESVMKEARTLSTLAHANIVKYHTSWWEEQPGGGCVVYIQMQYCTSSLKDMLEDPKALIPVAAFNELVQAVEYLHEKKIIHRDIAPKNIFFDDYNRLKLGDFGLAKKKLSLPREGGKVGTGMYSSPKQLENEMASDIFSLGMILFELNCRFSPENQDRDSTMQLAKDGIFPKEWEIANQELAEKIRSMLHPNRSLRPTASQILASLP